ncbi:hypothetical protein [Pseudomonas syringae]|uniref:hypothetical protein n=1 Tax=Pseudomonas syringae TaxID=317 RepID=UPI00200A0DDF|nr:hypothetical protein [Pseudomonas syringae]MCK9695742.1 hypothetical protein [Pseudomonas syringae pv. syringae]MCK9727223.1 hypothetical protein [Pseudomonas syringae pv. syringae]MCK9747577.1 hypothetical protein [Pseudomonas syringae pv. syringae]
MHVDSFLELRLVVRLKERSYGVAVAVSYRSDNIFGFAHRLPFCKTGIYDWGQFVVIGPSVFNAVEALWQRIMLAAMGKIEIGATATQKVMHLKQPN